ncbi:MAG: glycosyltransferase family 39 protein [Desulfovibrionaceae bacterium]|nr:glycosyltransferase family 39 protein [Desulfovibrionaceae bacterium]MBF0512542.1 glycosyltransferase family 39 protein [Desulfovibrionaceae bacterium]
MRKIHINSNFAYIVVLSFFVFLRAWDTSSAQMPFNGWDEFNHIGVSYHVHLYNKMPVSTDHLSMDLFPLLRAHPHPTGSYPFFIGFAKLYPGAAIKDEHNVPFNEGHDKQFDLYEAQHGPLFYHFLSKFVSGNDPHSLLAWIDTGRLFNCILFVLTVIIWHFILANIFYKYDMPILLYGGTLLFASYSISSFNFARFSNDSFSLFFGSLAIYYYISYIKEKLKAGLNLLPVFFLGLLSGVAVLSKATVLILIPTFIISIAIESFKHHRARGLMSIIVFLSGYLILAGSYHLRNYETYGVITGMQESVINSSHGQGTLDALKLLPQLPWNIWNGNYSITKNPFFYNKFTFIGGWSDISNPLYLSIAYDYCIKICLLMIFLVFFIPDKRNILFAVVHNNLELPLAILFGFLGLLYHSLQSSLAYGMSSTGGWYGMLILPIIFSFLLLGPALFGKITSFFIFTYLALLFNYSHYLGIIDLLQKETGINSVSAAINNIIAHHVIFKYSIFIPLIVESALIIALSLFCIMKIFRDTHSRARVQDLDSGKLGLA